MTTPKPAHRATDADPITLSLSAWRPKANGERDIIAHAEITAPAHLMSRAMLKGYAQALVPAIDNQLHPRGYRMFSR